MSKSRSIFLSDAPIESVEGNLLWPKDAEVMQQVEEIADAILAESGRLIFALKLRHSVFR